MAFALLFALLSSFAHASCNLTDETPAFTMRVYVGEDGGAFVNTSLYQDGRSPLALPFGIGWWAANRPTLYWVTPEDKVILVSDLEIRAEGPTLDFLEIPKPYGQVVLIASPRVDFTPAIMEQFLAAAKSARADRLKIRECFIQRNGLWVTTFDTLSHAMK